MDHIVFPLPLHQTQYPEAKDKSQKKKQLYRAGRKIGSNTRRKRKMEKGGRERRRGKFLHKIGICNKNMSNENNYIYFLGFIKERKIIYKKTYKGWFETKKVCFIEYTMAKENQKRLKAQNFYKKWQDTANVYMYMKLYFLIKF